MAVQPSIIRVGISSMGIAMMSVGVYCVVKGRAWHARFEQWLVDEPVRVRIDLEAGGVYAASFQQTCAIAHAQSLHVVPIHGEPLETTARLVSELSVDIRMMNAAGALIEVISLGPGMMWNKSSSTLVDRFHPVPDGDYTVRFIVEPMKHASPVRAADLVIRNELCGLERLPGTVSSGLGIIALIVGCITSVAARPWRPRTTRLPLTPAPSPPPASRPLPSDSQSATASQAAPAFLDESPR